jgi:hypothetical protein
MVLLGVGVSNNGTLFRNAPLDHAAISAGSIFAETTL